MKYLLDTDISSYYLRGRYNLLDVFLRKGIGNIRLSRPTVAQLEVLAYKNPSSVINLSAIQSLCEKFNVLEVDIGTWQNFSKLKAETELEGTIIGDIDILITSIATQYDLIVVTNNEKHFEGLVEVENWTVNN
ncbi:MAG: PIN domain-containing protein [Nitrospinota bacterium]